MTSGLVLAGNWCFPARRRLADFASAEDYLGRWERAFPLDKLEGYWSFLRVKYELARSRYAPAVREAEALVKVHPLSNYASAAAVSCAHTAR